MGKKKYVYLIKKIEDGTTHIVDHVHEKNGVMYYGDEAVAVYKRYAPSVDASAILIEKQITPTPATFTPAPVSTSPTVRKYVRQKGAPVQDHLGTTFPSLEAMCRHYDVLRATYASRIKAGKTTEEALLGKKLQPEMSPELLTVEDHLGNRYKNIAAMCKAYGISHGLYCHRLKRGYSAEEALTGKNKILDPVYDHTGKKYENINVMLKEFNLTYDAYSARLRNGWTLEEALTGVHYTQPPVYDHLGKAYPNTVEMCKAYGIAPGTFWARERASWPLEQALTTPIMKGGYYRINKKTKKVNLVLDHKGESFPSIKAMCAAHGVSISAFKYRIRQGLPLEEALNSNVKSHNSKKVLYDHLGNRYLSRAELCKAYNVGPSTFKSRQDRGWSLRRSLEGPSKAQKIEESNRRSKSQRGRRPSPEKEPVYDHLGQQFSSTPAMCEAYGIHPDTFRDRISKGMTLGQALTKTPSFATKSKPCEDHLGISYPSFAAMGRAYGLTKSIIMSRKKLGWPIEKILTYSPSAPQISGPYYLNGTQYPTLKGLCRDCNLHYDTVLRRIKRGDTIEEAAKPPRLQNQKNRRLMGARVKPIDHLGKLYPNQKTMCEAYAVPLNTFSYRISKGWDIRQALTGEGPVKTSQRWKNHKIQDHLGTSYRSIKEMCKAHSVSADSYRKAIREGRSIEEALAGPTPTIRYTDHKGNGYPSLSALYSAYGITEYIYKKRKKKGYSLEQILTGAEEQIEGVKDHLGNSYATITEMCNAYGIGQSLYYSRIKHGKTIEEALTAPKEDLSVEYKGIRYENLKSLARSFGINPGTLNSRMKLGWTLEEAIAGYKKGKAYYDHKGIEYPSMKDMCKKYGVNPGAYAGRLKCGWTKEQALLNKPPKKEPVPRKRHDHLGNEYPDLQSMCKAYGITIHDYQVRMTSGYSIEEALTSDEPLSIVQDHLGNKFDTIKEMCLAYKITTATYHARKKRGMTIKGDRFKVCVNLLVDVR